MKRCPECDREYWDESLNYCLDDGASLVLTAHEPPTAVLSPGAVATGAVESEAATRLKLSDEASAASADAPFYRSRPWVVPALLVIVFAGVGYLAYLYFPSGASPKPIDSVAVLPFVNKSGNPDSEYLSDGLAESLVYRLSQLPDLKVSPPSTVMRYKGGEVDPIRAGTELGVSAVVLGKIVERDGNLTVSAELIDVRQNKLLWGDQYDRKMSDLLATQREIASEIVEKLRLNFSGSERGLTKHYTENNEAYQLYLKARFHWNKRTLEGNKKTIEYLNQAIERDPNFALAYAALSDAYAVPNISLAPGDVMPKAKVAATRALELDDTLAEGHTSLARVLAAYDWDWVGAEKEFKRAIELNPNYPLAHEWYGGYLAAVGRLDESLAERRRALELDPLSAIVNFELGQTLFWSRDYKRAIEQFQKAMELDSNMPPIYVYLPTAFEMVGRYDDAIASFQKLPPTAGSNEATSAKAGLARVYAITGRKREARDLLSQLLNDQQKQYVPGSSIAVIYAGLGENDQAFTWLEKGFEQRAFHMQWLKVDPRWDALHSDPRFADIIRRMGLQ
jgi:TolB-like protein/Tfp pilus assembly protein PilF